MNKVLVTGLALGKDIGVCDRCNFDLEWLLRYPSILIWADKILVTGAIWDTISSHKAGGAESPEMAKFIKLIFDMAKAEGIIEVVNPGEIITPALKDAIFDEAHKDRTLLARVFSNHVRLGDEEKVPGQMFIDGYEYCSVRVWAIYGGLLLARAWDAHCLFDASAYDYCKYKFGLSGFPKGGDLGIIEGFQSVFEAYLPNDSIFPEYVLVSRELCRECANERSCRDRFLLEVETNLKKLFAWRDYDEIYQLKAVVEDIVDKRKKAGGVINPADVLRDLRSQEDKLRKRVRLVFPKVKRWANITTMLSVPVAVAGVASDAPLITVAGAALVGLSKLTGELVELLSSKYSWVGFVNKETELHPTA